MADDPTTDLGWLAFQYLSDELSATEAAAFEERMAHDQAAREVLAETVLLAQAVAASPLEAVPLEAVSLATPAARLRQRYVTPLAWAACGAAACLAMVLINRFASEDSPQADPVVAHPQQVDDAALALAWANASLPEASEAELFNSDSLASFEDDTGLVTGEADNPLSVPGWMFEAVHGLYEAQGGGEEPEES